MDGPALCRAAACLVTTAGLTLGACADLEPKPDPVPMSMYDSPVVANGIPGDETTDREKAPAERDRSDDEKRAAEAKSSDETATASEAKTATPATTDPSSNESADEPEPSLASKRPANADDEKSLASSDTEKEPQTVTTADETDDNAEKTSSEPSQRAESPDPPSERDATGGDGADRPTSAQSDAARYAAAIYELNGVGFPAAARTDIAKMYRHCRDRDAVFQSRAPKAGDLVFFHNVRDTNSDGRNNDWYTWVGLVERVHDSGTVELLGYRDGKVRSVRMNLNQPDTRKDGGEMLNARLRGKHSDDPPFTQYLAGQLFAGYCSLLGDRSELLVVDNWEPGMELKPPK